MPTPAATPPAASRAGLPAASAATALGRARLPSGLLATLTLARANARYWRTVAPIVRGQLLRWRERAAALPDPRRTLALGKLRDERFNPQLAATLATQAPRALRSIVAEAIVAGQVAYDYGDALEERRLAGGDAYARALAEARQRALERLPGASAVEQALRASAARCAQAQRLGHAAIDGGDDELRAWAGREAAGTGLGWPEWLAGAQASVLAEHALIALAADFRATPEQARALQRAYVSIGALTMLDSLVDRGRGASARELGYARWYESAEQMGERLATATRDSRTRARTLPNAAYHAMTLSGIVAYYASAPPAREPQARPVFAAVRAELGAELLPVLAVMRAWRLAKQADALAQRAGRLAQRAGRLTGAVAGAVAIVAAAAGLAPAARAATGGGDAARAHATQAHPMRAHAARALRARDEARLRYISASGSTLYETGRATGTLPGAMRVHMRVGPTFTGSFAIYAAGGSIDGRGSATPHGVGVYESFAGSLTVTGGSGRFRHASGTARLYGTFNRNTYALVVQTVGTLRY